MISSNGPTVMPNPTSHLKTPNGKKDKRPTRLIGAQFGRISVANTDSEAVALMDAAFDAAWRAVEERTA